MSKVLFYNIIATISYFIVYNWIFQDVEVGAGERFGCIYIYLLFIMIFNYIASGYISQGDKIKFKL